MTLIRQKVTLLFYWSQDLCTMTKFPLCTLEFAECGEDVVLSVVTKYQSDILPTSEILIPLLPCKQGCETPFHLSSS